MRYILSVFVLVFLFASLSFSQVRSNKKQRAAWTFQMGPAMGMIDGKKLTPTGFGAIIHPKIIFGAMGRNSSASFGMPLTILSFKQTTREVVINEGVSINVPLVFDFNFFHGAFKREKNRFGAYFGAGWDFNYMTFSTAFEDKDDITRDVKTNFDGLQHGPFFNIGMRFKLAKGASFDLRGYGTMSVAKTELTLFGVALLYNFGMAARKPGQGSQWGG